MGIHFIDLTEDLGMPAHTYAYYQLRELRRGETCEMRVGEDPAMLMQELQVLLRHAIHWEVIEHGPPHWMVEVHRREDVQAADLIDLLTRDHLRLDKLFAQALHLVNAGQVEAAAAPFKEYAAGLRAHLGAENDILAPAFKLPRDPMGGDPTSIMLREHDQILEQTVLIESYFDEGIPDASEVAPFFALISGALAKHESREENNLFPFWVRLLKQDTGMEKDLFESVKKALAAAE